MFGLGRNAAVKRQGPSTDNQKKEAAPMIIGTATSRVSSPKRVIASQAISAGPSTDAKKPEAGLPALSERPAPSVSHHRNFNAPSPAHTAPRYNRMSTTAAGASVAVDRVGQEVCGVISVGFRVERDGHRCPGASRRTEIVYVGRRGMRGVVRS